MTRHLRHLVGLTMRAALARRTVRARLTALYGALFLVSSTGLLAITNILSHGWPWPRFVDPSVLPRQDRPLLGAPDKSLRRQMLVAAAQQRAAALDHLLAGSAIALGVMAVASVALGWLVAGRVLRPLRDMTVATQRISADNLGERLAVPGPGDELKNLAGLTMRAALARRTVRARLTALYGALFLLSSTGLLAITNILSHGWPWPRFVDPSVLPRQDRPLPGAPDKSWQRQMLVAAAQQRAAALDHLLAVSAIALGVMAVASVALGWLVAGRVLRPLRDMTVATQRISADNLGERLAVPGPGDELKNLGDTIDGLLGRLETAFDAQRRFAANASHELRTPLAMMRTSVDVATAKPAVPPEVTVLAGKLREGLDQADRLLESLLLLARAEYGAMDEKEPVSLGHLLATEIENRADLIARMRVAVHQDTGDTPVTGNATLLTRMAGNLIDNAIRHNQPGGWVRAETTADGTNARLVIENCGPALDADRVRELAQPFRRLGADRTGSADGTGLGLSIVQAIVSAHGATLRLDARPQGGLRVVIQMPRAADLVPAGTPAQLAGPPAPPALAGAAR